MAAVLLSYTALDDASSEAMPAGFSMTDAGGAIPVAARAHAVVGNITHKSLPSLKNRASKDLRPF